MVRPPCFDSNGMKKGAWSEDEDNKLRAFILTYGHWNWRLLPKYAGLKRCGKSCRLRWVNHLKPGVKRGNFSKEEEDLIIRLHAQLGNKWSAIAMELPGRTDNDIKNFWNSRVARRPKPKPKLSPEATQASSMEMPPTLTQYHLVKQSKAAFDADSTQPQMDSWGEQLAASDTNFPPLLEEEFCYPQLHHAEFWCSIMNSEQDWIAYNEEGEGGVFDPLFCLWN